MPRYRQIRTKSGGHGVVVGPHFVAGLSDAQDPTPFEAAARRSDINRLRLVLPAARATPEPTSKLIPSRRVGPGRVQAYFPVSVMTSEGRARLGGIADEATADVRDAMVAAAQQANAAKQMVRAGFDAEALKYQAAGAAATAQASRAAEVAQQATLAKRLSDGAAKLAGSDARAATQLYGRAAEAMARAKRAADASVVAQVKPPSLMDAALAKAPPQTALIAPARYIPPQSSSPYAMYHGAAYSADHAVSGLGRVTEISRGLSGDFDWGALVKTVGDVAKVGGEIVDKMSGKTPTAPPAATPPPAAVPAKSFMTYVPYIAAVGALGVGLFIALK